MWKESALWNSLFHLIHVDLSICSYCILKIFLRRGVIPIFAYKCILKNLSLTLFHNFLASYLTQAMFPFVGEFLGSLTSVE